MARTQSKIMSPADRRAAVADAVLVLKGHKDDLREEKVSLREAKAALKAAEKVVKAAERDVAKTQKFVDKQDTKVKQLRASK